MELPLKIHGAAPYNMPAWIDKDLYEYATVSALKMWATAHARCQVHVHFSCYNFLTLNQRCLRQSKTRVYVNNRVTPVSGKKGVTAVPGVTDTIRAITRWFRPVNNSSRQGFMPTGILLCWVLWGELEWGVATNTLGSMGRGPGAVVKAACL